MTNEYIIKLWHEANGESTPPPVEQLRKVFKFVERDTRHACADAAMDAVPVNTYFVDKINLAYIVYKACMNTQVIKDD